MIEELIEAGMAVRWRYIGLALGLRGHQLDLIHKDNSTSNEDCLTDMASEWLKQTYDVAEYGEPSLERLSEAVSNPAGGNNPTAAEEILYNWTSPQSTMSQEHFGYQSLPPTVTYGQQSKSITVDGSEYIPYVQ